MNNGSRNEPGNSYHIPPEYQVYLHPDFDPQAFANSVLSNEPYLSTDTSQMSSGDVSSVLSKLNLGIEDITKQLKSQVTTHHLKLLTKAGSVASLDGSLQAVRNGLQQIEINVERLQTKIGHRYSTLETALSRLDRYQSAAELLRRTNRFVTLAKRLEAQMSELELEKTSKLDHKSLQSIDYIPPGREQQEIALAESALTLSELEKLLNSEIDSSSAETVNTNDSVASPNPNPVSAHSSIRSLKAIQPHVQMIVKSRQKVEEHMSKSLNEGLRQLDRSILSSSFQTAYNLSILDQSIGSLVFDLTEMISKKIKLAFDINSLAREAGVSETTATSSFGYKARSRTEPTSATLPQWTSALWSRLEGLIDDLYTCCVKVYTLEKVLEWKKDPITGVSFLSVVIGSGSILEERPSTVFWTTLGTALSKETRDTLRSSNFISQTLTANYPHLLRLFQDLFSRISLHTHTIYNSGTQSPETILTLRAILPLETIYLNRSMSKMTEASNGRVDKFTAVLINELDSARFDPLLVRSVTKKVKEVLDNYLGRMESRIATDYQSASLIGPVATSSQISNIDIFNNLSQLLKTLTKSIADYPTEIQEIFESSIELIEKIRQGIIEPILGAIKRELSMIIARMHHHPRNSSSNSTSGGIYMQELKSKLNLIRNEILGRLEKTQVDSISVKLALELLRIFLIHASLISPLSESMKLRLAADLAELEFEVTQFLSSDHQLSPVRLTTTNAGNDHLNQEESDDEDQMELTNQLNNLKVFRQLIFSDNPMEVENLINQSTLEKLIIIHHLIVKHQTDESSMNNNDRSTPSIPLKLKLKLIHQMNSWSEAEYLRWIEEYSSSNNHSFQSFEPLKILKNYLIDQRSHFESQMDITSVDSQNRLKWFLMACKFVTSN